MNLRKEIESKLTELYMKINPENLDWVSEVKSVISLFTKYEYLDHFKNALELVKRELEKRGDGRGSREIEGILYDLKKYEPDFLIERLKNAGYRLSNNKELKEAFEKLSFRLLEQIRLGKKDTVVGMIIRVFMVHGEKIPVELIEALKNKHDINMFRAYMYAFLGALLSKQGE